MAFFCDAPIDWAATGSMIGAIGSLVGVVISGFLTWKIIKQTKAINDQQIKQAKAINDQQNETKQLEIKIASFEIRYKVYDNFIRYYRRKSILFGNALKLNNGNVITPIQLYKSELGFKNTREDYFSDIQIMKDSCSTVNCSEFCYDEDISKQINEWMSLLCNVLFFNDNELKKLEEATNYIDQNDIVNKMKKDLKIAFHELENTKTESIIKAAQ